MHRSRIENYSNVILDPQAQDHQGQGLTKDTSHLAVRLVDSLSHGYGHDRGDTPAVTGDVGDAAVDGGVVQHFCQVLPQVAGPDFGSVAHTDDRTLRYTGVRAVAVQLPGLPDVGPAAVAGPGVRARAGGVQRRAAGTAAGPRRWV